MKDSIIYQVDCSVTVDEGGERLGQINTKVMNDSQLCAPDTFDPLPGNIDHVLFFSASFPSL